jgi:hypothetical protein
MTRYDVEAVLRPDPIISKSLVDLVVDLAISNGWNVERADDFVAYVNRRCIGTPRLETAPDVASFLHEGGHLEDPERHPDEFLYEKHNGTRLLISLTGELNAWTYALKRLGYKWTREMQGQMVYALRSYWPLTVRTYVDDERVDAVIAEGERLMRGAVVSIRPWQARR